MKIVKKKNLKQCNNTIVDKKSKKIINIDNKVVEQYNKLEEKYQKALYLSNQPTEVPAPSLKGFEFQKMNTVTIKPVDTKLKPGSIIAKKVEEAKLFAEELKADCLATATAELVNTEYADLLAFCGSKKFAPADTKSEPIVGGKELGSILKLTVPDVLDAATTIVDMDV